jgi:hypothetical protein
MIKLLLYKWFGLSDVPCETCEILRGLLAKSDSERRDLLQRLLDKDKPEPPQIEREEPQEIKPAFVPWRVRQQMLEAEDRKEAELINKRKREIAQLERELGIQNASNQRETIPIHADDSTRQEEISQGTGTVS